MTIECPQCKSPIAREGQQFCYRCGHDLRSYYSSVKPEAKDVSGSLSAGTPGESPAALEAPEESHKTLEAPAGSPPEVTIDVAKPAGAAEARASLRILLPTGDVFDRELTRTETQMGKGPRNDIVVADAAVSTTHALIRAEGGFYTLTDLGSRNGTFINGERITEPRRLQHGDVVGLGLSKLTFRLSGYSETGAINVTELLAVSRQAGPPPLTEDSLARAVISEGLATREAVERLRGPEAKDRRLYRALIEGKAVSEESLRDLMSKVFSIPVVELRKARIEEPLVTKFPPQTARVYRVFPVSDEGDRLTLAVADPTDTDAVEEVRRKTGKQVELKLATATEVAEQLDLHYGPKLIGVLPSGTKLEYPLNQKETEIGKAAHNHIVLSDPTVSNTHAIVLVRDGGYSIVDLGSRNGTFVNGDKLGNHARTLRHGDSIQFGQTVVTFRNPSETNENITATLSSEALQEVRRRAGLAGPAPSPDPPEPPAAAPIRDVSIKPDAPAIIPQGIDVTPAPLPPPEVVAAVPAEPAGEEKGEKKKKKKKKDERLKAAYVGAVSRILAQILAVAVAAGLAIYLARPTSAPGPAPNITPREPGAAGAPNLDRAKFAASGNIMSFAGNSYEASGVAYVPNTDGVLFVNDGSEGEVFWMQLDQSGNQVGDIKPVPLGARVKDPEGITYGGSFFYIVGSQSNPADGEQNALVRFAFDSNLLSVQGQADIIPDLRSFLIANVPQLRGEGEKAGLDGGLNIEGIAWDPLHERLLLGLRSPVVGDQALIVPLRLRDPRGPFSTDNMVLDEPAFQLPLGGFGIRDIQYIGGLKSFLIISGATELMRKNDFRLWEWSGNSDQSNPANKPREESALDQKMKPEGITQVRAGGRDFIFVVGDASSYFKLDYAR